MKKKWMLPMGLLLLLLFSTPICFAETNLENEAQQYLEDSGWEEIAEDLPEFSETLLEEQGIESILDVTHLSISELLKGIGKQITDSLRAPVQILCSLVGIILLCVLLQGVGTSLTHSNIPQVFNCIVSVFIVTILLDPVIECVLSINTTIEEFSIFLSTYIPAFAGIMTSSGQPLTAAAYNVLLFGICQLIGQFLKAFFVPLISCYLALAIVSEICPQMGISRMVSGIKTFITWVLGLSMTIFFGLLSIQSVVAASGDTLAVKTTKFFIASFIPVVGGALSDLFVASQGCMQFLKSTVGVFGVVVAVFTFLPVMIKAALWYITAQIGGLIGGIFGVSEVERLLKSIASALGVILAILLYYSLLFIISTTLIIVAFKGG